MNHKYTMEINEKEIILTPEKHNFTLIWIHGLNESPQAHLRYILTKPLLEELCDVRVVLPAAPKRNVTAQGNSEMPSWFDIKFRSEKSFLVDFDEAFSKSEVEDSYQNYLLPIIERENALLAGKPNRIFIGGFSQGCGMALHCLYSTKIEFAGVVGVSGYLFPITPFDKNNPTPKVIVYGLADVLRPWEYVKVTYQDKIDSKQIVLIEGMEHEVKKKETNEAIAAFLRTTKNSLMQ